MVAETTSIMGAIAQSEVGSGQPEQSADSPFLHASVVIVGDSGVLIRGHSGAGKSGLCLALVEEAAKVGSFARLVADDRVEIAICSGRIVARPHSAIAGQVERRGQGILTVPHERAAVVRLVIDLGERDKTPRLPAPDDLKTVVRGLDCPRLRLPHESSPVENAQAVLAFLSRTR
jgi:serine kinase of HPr protein (carbohydrate metabolism regulator)